MGLRQTTIIAIALLLLNAVLWADDRAAPEFTQTSQTAWINSEPLTLDALRGNVVLVDFWTFACWNCYRSFPWLNSLEASLGNSAFKIIGIHSPEFDYERDRDAVVAQAAKFKLKHPIMIDNDFGYWRAMDNQYWPAFYVIDATGQVRHSYVGETHAGDKQALRIEADIRALLAEADH